MAVDPIVLSLHPEEGERGFVQRVADGSLWTGWELGPSSRPAIRPERRRIEPDETWTRVYEGPGLDLGEVRRVVARKGSSGQHRIDFEGDESFVVAADAGQIVRLVTRATGEPPGAASRERALGAPLALALAVRGVHLLHASAIEGPRGVIALTADSGVGKSTLAAQAGALGSGWRRVADDQLPVRLGDAAQALPHFPQLKLAASEAYPANAAVACPLVALVELRRHERAEPPALAALGASGAALALARATTAARLFPPDLLAAHLGACARAATAMRVARLSYPSGRERVPEALALLAGAFD